MRIHQKMVMRREHANDHTVHEIQRIYIIWEWNQRKLYDCSYMWKSSGANKYKKKNGKENVSAVFAAHCVPANVNCAVIIQSREHTFGSLNEWLLVRWFVLCIDVDVAVHGNRNRSGFCVTIAVRVLVDAWNVQRAQTDTHTHRTHSSWPLYEHI